MSSWLYVRRRGEATAIRFAAPISNTFTLFSTAANWTPVTGDVKISKDGGNFVNATNLPTLIGGTGSATWTLSLTAAEMDADEILVQVADAATAAVYHLLFRIDTTMATNRSVSEIVHGAGGASVYHVATTGNDSNDGLTWATAKLTIGGANAVASAGDIVLVGPGTFSEIVESVEGVTYRGARMGATVIEATLSNSQGVFGLAAGITLEDMEIRTNVSSTNGFVFGHGSSSPADNGVFDRIVCRRVRFNDIAGNDVIVAGGTGVSFKAVFIDCQLRGNWDGLTNAASDAFEVDLFDCSINLGAGKALFSVGINDITRVNFVNCTIVSGGNSDLPAIDLQDVNSGFARCTLVGTSISMRNNGNNSTWKNFNVLGANSKVIVGADCAIDETAVSTTSSGGSIIYADGVSLAEGVANANVSSINGVSVSGPDDLKGGGISSIVS